jgi:hypothetical protein
LMTNRIPWSETLPDTTAEPSGTMKYRIFFMRSQTRRASDVEGVHGQVNGHLGARRVFRESDKARGDSHLVRSQSKRGRALEAIRR